MPKFRVTPTGLSEFVPKWPGDLLTAPTAERFSVGFEREIVPLVRGEDPLLSNEGDRKVLLGRSVRLMLGAAEGLSCRRVTLGARFESRRMTSAEGERVIDDGDRVTDRPGSRWTEGDDFCALFHRLVSDGEERRISSSNDGLAPVEWELLFVRGPKLRLVSARGVDADESYCRRSTWGLCVLEFSRPGYENDRELSDELRGRLNDGVDLDSCRSAPGDRNIEGPELFEPDEPQDLGELAEESEPLLLERGEDSDPHGECEDDGLDFENDGLDRL